MSKLTVQKILDEGAIRGIPDRGITLATAQHFGVRTMYSGSTGEPVGHYFPVTKQGRITGFIERRLDKPKDEAWMTIGTVSVKSDLVGQEHCNGGAKLFIVEGMYDVLSAWQALRFSKRNERRSDPIIPSVCSVALGAGHAGEQVANNLETLKKYNKVVTCFDNDTGEVNEGQKGVRDVALVYPEIENVLLPCNDPNELLLKDPEELALYLMAKHEPYEIGEVVQGIPDKSNVMAPIQPGIEIPEYPILSRRLQGLREGELTWILAPPKTGKTTFVKHLNYLLGKQSPTFGCYLEEDLKKTQQSFIAMHCGVPLPKFRRDPSIADSKCVDEALKLLQSFGFYDDGIGKITADKVIPLFEYLHHKGYKTIIFDHLQFVVANSKGDNERKEIDNLCNELASWKKKTGTRLIIVSHITFNKNYIRPKEKDGSVQYPHWYEVGEHDGRGSSAYAHTGDNMILMDKQILQDGSRGLTRLKLAHNREVDDTGFCDYLTVDPKTGIMHSTTEI